LDRPVLGQIPASTLRPALQIIGIVALVSLMTLTAERAILILLAATGLSVVAAFWMLRRRLRGTRAAVPSYQSRVWFIALATISVTILCQRINQHLGTVLLQYLSNAEAVALYQPAVEALILTSLPGLAVTAILMPRLRTALVGGDHALQQRLITRSGRLIAVCTLAVSAFLLLLGPGGLALIFGAEFGAAYPAVAVIAVTQALAAFLGLPNVVLAQAHRERRVAVTMTGGVVANIAASLMVIPMFGPLGAAVATGLTLLVVRAVLSRACRRDLGLETRITFRVEKACSP
ncbi:MAG: polysaccharide biosynthesis C-terminal domain-containing protein, partial [Pseudomonadota bacterium]